MTMLKWSLTKNNLENLITKLRLLDWTKSWRVTVVEAKASRSNEQNYAFGNYILALEII
jgi:hypothetical protein